MRLIDGTAHSNRWRRRHPTEKLVPTLGLMAVALAAPPLIVAPLIIALTALAAIVGAGIRPVTFARVLAVPAGFIALSLPGLLLSIDLQPQPALAWVAGGTAIAVDVCLRALACAACLTFLVLSTPVADVLGVLGRLGVPKALLEVMLLTYRFTFILVDTAAGNARAQSARLGNASFRARCRAFAALARALLQTALARVRRLELGLAARGHSGGLDVLSPLRPLSAGGLAGGLAVVTAVAGIGVLAS